MADKKIKFEALNEASTPADLAPAIAKRVNDTAIGEGTKKKLLTMMGKPETEPKLLRESAAKEAAEDLQKFKKNLIEKAPELSAVEAIRTDVHDKIMTTLGGEFTVNGGADKYKIEDLDAIKAKFKKPEAEAKAKTEATAKTDAHPEVDAGITTADSPPLLSSNAARLAGGVALGVPLAVGGTAAATSWLGGGTFTGGLANGVRSVGSLFSQPFKALGGPTAWNSLVVQPGNWLASKLGITTGTAATNGALAGVPGWVGTGVGALGVAGGVYLGSKVVNGVNGWLGHKAGYTPWSLGVVGKIPVVGTVAKAASTVLQLPLEAGKKVFGAGKSAFNWMWGKGKEAAEHREGATHFGIGALAGAGIAAALTGGSSLVLGLVGGHLARKGLKGKHLSDLVPAPFGVKKSGDGGAAH